MSHIDEGTLHAYLDGELNERQLLEIEEHVSACDPCSHRLESARAAAGRASALMAELEPAAAQAPSFRELEERAAARAQAAAPRRSRVRPRLAWAASIAIAFAVGWYSQPFWSGQSPRDLGFTAAEPVMAPQPSSKSADEQSAAREAGQGVADAVGGLSTDEVRAAEEAPAQSRGRAADRRTSLTEAEEDAPVEARRQEVAGAENETATREMLNQPAVERAAQPVAEAEPAAPPAEAFGIESQLEQPKGEADAAALAGRAAPDSDMADEMRVRADFRMTAGEAYAGMFRPVGPQEATVWLDADLRTLSDLQLVRTEVGPGAAVEGGLEGLPAVRLIYIDAAGNEIALIQQHVGEGRDLDDAEADPALLIERSGLRAYRWRHGGYRLTLLGTVSTDSLQALSERVR
jgi:anti-sigma factor RsiW